MLYQLMNKDVVVATYEERMQLRNPFDDVIARITFDGTGVYGRQNSPTSPEYATSGSFAKCWVREGDQISLLKRESAGYANADIEPYSEALASAVLDAAGVAHVPYEVVSYHGTLASKCPLFTSEEVGFVSAHRFFDGPFDVPDMLAFCAEHGGTSAFARWWSWTPSRPTSTATRATAASSWTTTRARCSARRRCSTRTWPAFP